MSLDGGGSTWDDYLKYRAHTEAGMVENKERPKRGKKNPIGDRQQFLMMMTPKIIEAIKLAAVKEGRPAWDIMEEAAEQWLERRKTKK